MLTSYNLIAIIILSYAQIICFLGNKHFVSQCQTTILLALLAIQILCTLFFPSPYILIMTMMYFCLQVIFIARYLNNWLPVALFLFLGSSLVILSWLFTYDIVTFLHRFGKISFETFQLLIPLSLFAQQILLFFLIQLFKKIDARNKLFDSIFQIQKNYKLLSFFLISFFLLLTFLRQIAIITIVNSSFSYSTFILLIFSLILWFTVYFYSRYYQQQLKQKLLKQQYNNELEKISLADEFRHDYRNILLSIVGYIENGNQEEALDYVASITDYSEHSLGANHYEDLINLMIPSVQGLLITFIDRANDENISLHLLIPHIIQETDISIRLIDFIHCLTSMFDYALLMKSSSAEKQLYLTIKKEEDELKCMLTNFPKESISLEKISLSSLNAKKQWNNTKIRNIKKILNRYRGTSFSFYEDPHYLFFDTVIKVNSGLSNR